MDFTVCNPRGCCPIPELTSYPALFQEQVRTRFAYKCESERFESMLFGKTRNSTEEFVFSCYNNLDVLSSRQTAKKHQSAIVRTRTYHNRPLGCTLVEIGSWLCSNWTRTDPDESALGPEWVRSGPKWVRSGSGVGMDWVRADRSGPGS
jgi:hypothetical protein